MSDLPRNEYTRVRDVPRVAPEANRQAHIFTYSLVLYALKATVHIKKVEAISERAIARLFLKNTVKVPMSAPIEAESKSFGVPLFNFIIFEVRIKENQLRLKFTRNNISA